ncbi:MAG TPA: SHOCT domain-containing protein [Acidimicrobiia bacterium]|nr:SHOCT domain-containing protein [Acidimicrobiia bacterium]
MWGYGGFGFIWMALFWIGVILLVIWAVRRAAEPTPRQQHSALEILEERFARGELDPDEFTTRRQQLVR